MLDLSLVKRFFVSITILWALYFSTYLTHNARIEYFIMTGLFLPAFLWCAYWIYKGCKK